MTELAVDSVFDGDGDDEYVTVDMPLAYLRSLLSSNASQIRWLDSNYEKTAVTSEQLAVIEAGIGRAASAASREYNTMRVAQLHALTMMLPGLVAFWPGYPVGDQAADIGPSGLYLTRTGATAFSEDSNGRMPALLSISTNPEMGETSYWSITSSVLDITGVESGMQNPGLTIVSWVYLDTGYTSRLIAYRHDASNHGFRFYLTADKKPIFTIQGTAVISTTAHDDGWHHLACVWVPGYRMTIHIDGDVTDESLSAIPGSITSGSRPFYICHNSVGGAMHQGATAVYRAPLTDEAIHDHYVATRGCYG